MRTRILLFLLSVATAVAQTAPPPPTSGATVDLQSAAVLAQAADALAHGVTVSDTVLHGAATYASGKPQNGLATLKVKGADESRLDLSLDPSGATVTLTAIGDEQIKQEASPAPTGENVKTRYFDYDGFGNIAAVCESTPSGSPYGTCAYNFTGNGSATVYTYNAIGKLTNINHYTNGVNDQSRTYTYDGLGRLGSATESEAGMNARYWGYDFAWGCPTASAGDMTRRIDPLWNIACQQFDALHRMTKVTYSGPYASYTPTKVFVYDAATVTYQGNPVAMANAKGRLAEAYTCFVCGLTPTKITDLFFSYTPRGEIADVYQLSPNSGGYYKVSAQYWENKQLKTLSNVPGLPTFSFGLDGAGRINSVSASSGQNPIPASGVTYDTSNAVTHVSFGSGDADDFTYDPNTHKMTQYKFTVNTATVTGNLTWSANGSLRTHNVVDTIHPVNTQNCTFLYDDFGRIANANCGSVWSQTFAYDAFGNIAKSGSGSFQATYNGWTNHITSIPGATVTYDGGGNITNDGTNAYTWDAEGRPTAVGPVTIVYDAMDRPVEQTLSGVTTELLYDPQGRRIARMSGQTLQKAYLPLPGGALAYYEASGLVAYRHADYAGSVRLASTPTQTAYSGRSYAPFGEVYGESSGPADDRVFAGLEEDTFAGLYDSGHMEFSAAEGRWLSPAQSCSASRDLENPQSLNRYARLTNTDLTWKQVQWTPPKANVIVGGVIAGGTVSGNSPGAPKKPARSMMGFGPEYCSAEFEVCDYGPDWGGFDWGFDYAGDGGGGGGGGGGKLGRHCCLRVFERSCLSKTQSEYLSVPMRLCSQWSTSRQY